MSYEYRDKVLWDVPVVWNKPTDNSRIPVSLRKRTPWVSDEKMDLEKLINSPIGEQMIKDFLPYFTYGDEMDPALLAYYEGLEKGLKKEMHQRDDFWERWATFVPLSAFREDNKERRYPLLFVLHGSNMPINWEECSGFTKIAARDEIILCIPENHSVENMMRIFQEMQENYPIDLTRVYCTGYSLGGRQTNELLFAHPEILAAACPSGSLAGPFSCTDTNEEKIAKVASYRVPVMTVSGLNEGLYLFPYYKDAPDKGCMWEALDESVLGSAPKIMDKIESLNRRLRSLNCRPVTLEEVQATAYSGIDAERLIGAPGAVYEIKTILNTNHYFASYMDRFGDEVFKIVAVDNFPHWPSPTMAELCWDFMKHYSRDKKNGKLIDDRKYNPEIL